MTTAPCVSNASAALRSTVYPFGQGGADRRKVNVKMAKDKYYGKTLRKNFARHEEVTPMPNLLEIQKKSYQWFLDTGLREVFADVAAITDYQGNLELTFIDYKMDEAPKYDVEECKARDATYAAPLKVKVRLRNKETEEIKEQEIFMGDFPLMTHSGTFVINGAERVVVSQIVRSPGVYYGKELDLKTDLPILTATVIPYRGAWLEYETDANEVFWVRIDKNRKIPITCLIRALGLKTDQEILDRFGDDPRIAITLEKDPCKNYEDAMLEIYRKLRPGEPPTVEAAETLMRNLFFDPRRYDLSIVGRYKFNKKLSLWARVAGCKLVFPVADPATGEILFDEGHLLSKEDARLLDAVGVGEASGRLEEVLRSLGVYYDEEDRLFAKIRSSVGYPAALLCIMSVILVFTVAIILPIFSSAYENLSGSMTSGSFNTVGASIAIGWVALAIVLVATVAALYVAICARNESGRDRVTKMLERYPGTRRAMYQLALSRFVSALSSLVASGVQEEEAMRKAMATIDHAKLQAELQAAYDSMIDLENPRSLAQAIVEHEIVEPVYGRMLLMGTRAGSVDEVLGHLAQVFFDDANMQIDAAVDRVEPTLAAFLNNAVGATLMAVMLPLNGIMGSSG